MVIEDRISQSSTRLNEQQKDDEKWRQKLNDSEHQISTMKAQLQHVSATKQDEVEKLQKKLGFVEIMAILIIFYKEFLFLMYKVREVILG